MLAFRRKAEETVGESAPMDPLGSLRNTAHVGPNRCWPCTVLNAAILAGLVLVVSVLSPLLALLVLVLGIAGITLRGYVIPFTPRFAPRAVGAFPGAGRLFPSDKHDSNTGPSQHSPYGGTPGSIGDDNADGEHVLTTLIDAGVIVGDTDLGLSEDVATDWRQRMDALATESTDNLSDAVIDAAPDPIKTRTVGEDGREWIVVTDQDESLASETWLSRPVAIADVAAVDVLDEYGVPQSMAADAAPSLRLFLDACPDCGGAVAKTTGDGCCGGFGPGGPTPVLACRECDQRLAALD